MACMFFACHSIIIAQKNAIISGKVKNPIKNKITIDIPSYNKRISLDLDKKGKFSEEFEVKNAVYARISNGKATIPAYLSPGTNLKVTFDARKLSKKDYKNVSINCKNPETKMMINYYSKQLFPASEEMFGLTPKEFKKKMKYVANHNDSIISVYSKKNKYIDTAFVNLFRIQVKVPLAISYFYYPTYHAMMVPDDKSEYPENFNIFDDTLPKNNLKIYNSVYRYKTYVVSFWNLALSSYASKENAKGIDFINNYIDILKKMKLKQAIKDDVANNFIKENYKKSSNEGKEIIKKRYSEILKNKTYISNIKKIINQ